MLHILVIKLVSVQKEDYHTSDRKYRQFLYFSSCRFLLMLQSIWKRIWRLVARHPRVCHSVSRPFVNMSRDIHVLRISKTRKCIGPGAKRLVIYRKLKYVSMFLIMFQIFETCRSMQVFGIRTLLSPCPGLPQCQILES